MNWRDWLLAHPAVIRVLFVLFFALALLILMIVASGISF